MQVLKVFWEDVLMAAPVLIFSANVQKTQKIIINFERQLGFLLQDRNLKHI